MGRDLTCGVVDQDRTGRRPMDATASHNWDAKLEYSVCSRARCQTDGILVPSHNAPAWPLLCTEELVLWRLHSS